MLAFEAGDIGSRPVGVTKHIKMNKRYLKENFENAVKSSISIKEALAVLGLRAAGGNYNVFHKYVKLYKIDISHFDNMKAIYEKSIGKSVAERKIPLELCLVENSTYDRTDLKRRLYSEGLKERKCELCSQGEEWQGKKMSLILDHKNGVHNDNRIENLRIVCPNCNATLDTHAGKNIKHK